MDIIAGLVLSLLTAGDTPTFTDVTAEAGVTFQHVTSWPNESEPEFMTPGVAVADFDGDGWLDLFVQGGLEQNARLFLNDGDGTFTDHAEAWGVDLVGIEGASVSVGDVDGNGRPDVYAGNLYHRNHLYLNTGAGFVEWAVQAGVDLTPPEDEPDHGNTFGATFGDVDRDGDLDLYVVKWNPPVGVGTRLFRNNGAGIFTDVTAAYGLAVDPDDDFHPFSPCLVDLDFNGWVDLPVAADFGTSRYYAGAFGTLFVPLDQGTGTDENGMGSAFGDYDNDGDLDWFVSSIYDDDGKPEANWGISGNRLYRNEGGHVFTDATDDAGVRDGGWGWGTSFGDLDHDGWLDLVLTNGFSYAGSHPDPTFLTDPMRVWMNAGGVFTDVAAAAGVSHTGPGKAVALFDMDRDGDLDLVVTTNLGDLTLYRNDTDVPPNGWLQIDLDPPPGAAPHGFGAFVRVTTDGVTRLRAVHGGMTFMGQNPARVHIAFPPTSAIEEMRVDWPDGTVTRRHDVLPGAIITIQPSDLDGDGMVSFRDLLELLSTWGSCVGCGADLDGDDVVGNADLDKLLSGWDG